MADNLVLDLVEKGLVTDQITLTIGYDRESLTDPNIRYCGEVAVDFYGRKVPKHAHGTANLPQPNSSASMITRAVMELYARISDPQLLVRRVTISAAHIMPRGQSPAHCQMDLFAEPVDEAALEREHRRQQAVVSIRRKFGKNAILKGMNLEEGATSRERNAQIGGHKA